jgi:integrase/recombinase XerC
MRAAWGRGAVDDYGAEKVQRGHWNPGTHYIIKRLLYQLVGEPVAIAADSRRLAAWVNRPGLSANYRRHRWSVARGFIQWLGVPFDVDAPKVPKAVARPLREVDVRALLDVCDPRDEVIVSLGVCEGLRRAEMAGLELGDVDIDGRIVFVTGKGGHQRWTPLTDATAGRIDAYIEAERGSGPGPLIQSRRGGGALRPQSISERARTLIAAAGLTGPGVTLHALRHTAATRLWMETADLFWTQQLLGHSNIRTTAMYVQARPTAQMRDAMNAAAL